MSLVSKFGYLVNKKKTILSLIASVSLFVSVGVWWAYTEVIRTFEDIPGTILAFHSDEYYYVPSRGLFSSFPIIHHPSIDVSCVGAGETLFVRTIVPIPPDTDLLPISFKHEYRYKFWPLPPKAIPFIQSADDTSTKYIPIDYDNKSDRYLCLTRTTDSVSTGNLVITDARFLAITELTSSIRYPIRAPTSAYFVDRGILCSIKYSVTSPNGDSEPMIENIILPLENPSSVPLSQLPNDYVWAVSNDGLKILFRENRWDRAGLYVYDLHKRDTTWLSFSENPLDGCFSPDSRYVAYAVRTPLDFRKMYIYDLVEQENHYTGIVNGQGIAAWVSATP